MKYFALGIFVIVCVIFIIFLICDLYDFFVSSREKSKSHKLLLDTLESKVDSLCYCNDYIVSLIVQLHKDLLKNNKKKRSKR